jgi:Uma2 family endonuclease
MYRGAPDLALEVVSESESAADLRAKVRDYLEAGSKAVWLLYPDLRVVAVYTSHGVMELFSGQVLEAPEILPGFRASVDEFFA